MKKGKLLFLLGTVIALTLSMTACGSDPYSGVDFSDYIKVGKYKGLEVEKYTVDVSKKDVEEEINNRLEQAATTEEVTKGTVKDGDTIVIDYEGKVDGETFAGGSAQDYNLTIGSNSLIEGFEKGLVGVKVGDTKELKLTFPKNYSQEDLKGKDVVFTVTVKAKQEKTTPKLSDDFVKSQNGDATTVAEYKKEVKKELEEAEKKTGEDTQKQYLWTKVVDSSEVLKDKDGNEKYPEKALKASVETQRKAYEDYATNYDMTFSAFVTQQMGMTEDQLDEQLQEYAKTMVKQEEIIHYIADKEKIEVSDEEYEKYIDNLLGQYGYTQDTYKETNNESYEDSVGKEQIMTGVYLQKVQELILKNAKVVDKVSDDDSDDKDK